MGIRKKRYKRQAAFSKTKFRASGERARFYNLGIQDRQAGRDHRFGYLSYLDTTAALFNLHKAYNDGFYNRPLGSTR